MNFVKTFISIGGLHPTKPEIDPGVICKALSSAARELLFACWSDAWQKRVMGIHFRLFPHDESEHACRRRYHSIGQTQCYIGQTDGPGGSHRQLIEG